MEAVWQELSSGSRWLHAARFAVQATISALATYWVTQLLGLQEVSWAIISALFAIQATVGGSLISAIDRVLGAVLGVFIGIAVLFAFGSGEWRSVPAIGVAVAATSLVVGAMPSLQYGLVTVAIMVVSPGEDLVATAVQKVAAITLGALVGTIVATIVLPVRAHRRAERHLSRAVRDCADLLSGSVDILTGLASPDLSGVQERIRAEILQAQSMLSQTQIRRLRGTGPRPTPMQLLQAVERLWYTLALVERLATGPLPGLSCAGRVGDALSACEDYLTEIADAVARNSQVSSPRPVSAAIDAMRRDLGDPCGPTGERGLSSPDRERLFAFSFAWHGIDRTLREMAETLGTGEFPLPRRERPEVAPDNDAAASAG